jgi:putative transposase
MGIKYREKQRALLHIYNRGNRKQRICEDFEDYSFFYNSIRRFFQDDGFDLLCFCVMPNHYHILAKQQGPVHISRVMQRIGMGYTKYFNMKYGLSGHLFQGTYQYKIVGDTLQLKTVAKYIVDNPLKIDLPCNYPYLFNNQYLINYYLLSSSLEKDELAL